MEVFQEYGIVQTTQNTKSFIERLVDDFKKNQEYICYENLTPPQKAKEVFGSLNWDTSTCQAEWVSNTQHRINASILQYKERLRITLATWFDQLSPELQNILAACTKEIFGDNFDCNSLHPTIGYEIKNLAFACLRQTGIDSQIEMDYFPTLGKGIDSLDGLEEETERLNRSQLKIYQENILSENSYSFKVKLDFLFMMNNLDQPSRQPFKWDSFMVEYYKSELQIIPPINQSVAERDELWKPHYLKQIKNLIQSYSQDRLFYYFGLDHGYNFFKTLKDHPELISTIQRYNIEKGWGDSNH